MLRWLATILCLASLASCTTEGPPRVEATAEATVGLEAGESQTLRFEVEAEAIGAYDEGFRVTLSEPSLSELSQLGVTVERSWAAEGGEENNWPERITIERGKLLVGDFYLTLANTGQDQLEFDIVIRASASPPSDIGGAGGAESFRLAIRRR